MTMELEKQIVVHGEIRRRRKRSTEREITEDEVARARMEGRRKGRKTAAAS